MKADDLRLELSGYTLEPAALNGWVARLGDSPLLEGQQLSLVKVERVKPEAGSAGSVVPPAVAGPVWSYTLVTAWKPAAAGDKP